MKIETLNIPPRLIACVDPSTMAIPTSSYSAAFVASVIFVTVLAAYLPPFETNTAVVSAGTPAVPVLPLKVACCTVASADLA